MSTAFELTGSNLTPAALALLARGARPLSLCAQGMARMAQARGLVDHVIAEQIPVYGVTTGLGARAGETLDAAQLQDFSIQTILGRAHAVGPPMPPEQVRAAMIVRLNTLLLGRAGASPALAEHLLAVLNAGLVPEIGQTGSIGAGDLVLNASWALTLLGQGQIRTANGTVLPATQALAAQGLAPLVPGPRDGLALCNHSGVSAGIAALGLAEATQALAMCDATAALSLEGFRANLSPFDPRLLATGDKPGQAHAAERIMHLIAGSTLCDPAQARRLQDPLSLRNIPQIHGSTYAALDFAQQAIQPELNGSTDNPVALFETGDILSGGGYLSPQLTNALETVNRAFVTLCMAQIARMSKLLDPRFSGLALFLAVPGSGSNGFAPVMKTAEALVSELAHAAQPVPVWPSLNATGVEDVLSPTPVAAGATRTIAARAALLCGIEALIARTAIAQRQTDETPPVPGPRLRDLCARLDGVVAPMGQDRPMGGDIETATQCLRDWVAG